jgi:hypothetical protein
MECLIKSRPLETEQLNLGLIFYRYISWSCGSHCNACATVLCCVICQSDTGRMIGLSKDCMKRFLARLPSEKRHDDDDDDDDDDVTVARLSVGIRSLSSTRLSWNEVELNLYLSSVKNRPRSIPPRPFSTDVHEPYLVQYCVRNLNNWSGLGDIGYDSEPKTFRPMPTSRYIN